MRWGAGIRCRFAGLGWLTRAFVCVSALWLTALFRMDWSFGIAVVFTGKLDWNKLTTTRHPNRLARIAARIVLVGILARRFTLATNETQIDGQAIRAGIERSHLTTHLAELR